MRVSSSIFLEPLFFKTRSRCKYYFSCICSPHERCVGQQSSTSFFFGSFFSVSFVFFFLFFFFLLFFFLFFFFLFFFFLSLLFFFFFVWAHPSIFFSFDFFFYKKKEKRGICAAFFFRTDQRAVAKRGHLPPLAARGGVFDWFYAGLTPSFKKNPKKGNKKKETDRKKRKRGWS